MATVPESHRTSSLDKGFRALSTMERRSDPASDTFLKLKRGRRRNTRLQNRIMEGVNRLLCAPKWRVGCTIRIVGLR
jgi:hypothetical protein